MKDALEAMSQEAMSQHLNKMLALHQQEISKRWVNAPELWEPDDRLLQLFGSLPNVDD